VFYGSRLMLILSRFWPSSLPPSRTMRRRDDTLCCRLLGLLLCFFFCSLAPPVAAIALVIAPLFPSVFLLSNLLFSHLTKNGFLGSGLSAHSPPLTQSF